MHFQPIWDLSSDRVLGYEALARPAPGSGFVFPSEAFGAASRCGLTRVLDEVCISRALERVPEMPTGSRLFLNLHPDTLVDPKFDPTLFADVVAEAGLEVSRVVVEVTEQGQISSELLNQRLAELRALDFRIALDDVGAGNAGIQVLRTVRVDYLKIDRSVVAEALSSDAARAVLSALLAYAAEMDSYVIAEGIETNDMLGFVQALSLRAPRIQVGGVQGFHLGRPHSAFTVRQDADHTEPAGQLPTAEPSSNAVRA
jgi:EAL domain-containing protein (putative c-di-GMP-specific phosphodiesterase class I)